MRINCAMLGLFFTGVVLAAPKTVALPRFTEEREAAALHFVKRNLPELQPLLDKLKRTSESRYKQEVCEIFQVSEILADLEDTRRHDIELKIWRAENRGYILIARLRSPSEDEKKKLQDQLREVARELVELDVQMLEEQVEQLDKELAEVKGELSQARSHLEQNVKSRFEGLLEKVPKPKK
jgi:hypothetical protein